MSNNTPPFQSPTAPNELLPHTPIPTNRTTHAVPVVTQPETPGINLLLSAAQHRSDSPHYNIIKLTMPLPPRHLLTSPPPVPRSMPSHKVPPDSCNNLAQSNNFYEILLTLNIKWVVEWQHFSIRIVPNSLCKSICLFFIWYCQSLAWVSERKWRTVSSAPFYSSLYRIFNEGFIMSALLITAYLTLSSDDVFHFI